MSSAEADVKRKLRVWACAAGHTESELDRVVERMYGEISHALAEELRDARPQYGEAWRAWGAAADHIDSGATT